jgi:hypothetical protein
MHAYALHNFVVGLAINQPSIDLAKYAKDLVLTHQIVIVQLWAQASYSCEEGVDFALRIYSLCGGTVHKDSETTQPDRLNLPFPKMPRNCKRDPSRFVSDINMASCGP